MQKLFNQCPACGGQLIITECKCPACQLQMRGEFQTGQLSSLSDETLTFIKVFLSARGNLTEVERVLGISYPTIRNKLDEINSISTGTVRPLSSLRKHPAALPKRKQPLLKMCGKIFCSKYRTAGYPRRKQSKN